MKISVKNNSINTLFISTGSERCNIYTLFQQVGKKKLSVLSLISKHTRSLLLDKKYESLSCFLKSVGVKNADKRKLIVLANRDEHYPLLIYGGEQYIKAAWFDTASHDNMFVLFTPGGSRILKQGEWAKTFPKWVSFAEHYSYMVGLPVLEEEAMTIYPAFFSAIIKGKNSADIKQKMVEVIEESKKRIPYKNGQFEDIMALAYVLDSNLVNLECQ